jgi:hypothetical protein
MDVTTQRFVKFSQAQSWIGAGVYAWAAEGKAIRRLTVAEMVARRSELPGEPNPLPGEHDPVAELPGLVTRGLEGVHHKLRVAFQATLLISPKKVQALAADRIMPLAEFRRLLAHG